MANPYFQPPMNADERRYNQTNLPQ